jgi:hypothetical protein
MSSNVSYLVDSGAALSIVAASTNRPDYIVGNANDGLIPSWNFVIKKLHFGAQRFSFQILQANVSQPILGAEFFKANSSKIDFEHGRILCIPPNSPSTIQSLPFPPLLYPPFPPLLQLS